MQNNREKSPRKSGTGGKARPEAAPSGRAPVQQTDGPDAVWPDDDRHAEWRETLAGECARHALDLLARRMSSGWPRRGHNLLELYCADGHFLEMFWQSGFDVTGQDQSSGMLKLARERLKNAAEFTQAHPEHLPYDDDHFDYVVCLAGMEFAEDPEAMLKEMFRVAAKGVLLAFPSSWSLHCLGSVFTRKKAVQNGKLVAKRFYSPMKISAMLNQAGDGNSSWVSALIGPAWSWKLRWLRRVNYVNFPFPLGAIVMVRVDLNAPLGGTPLTITGKRQFKRQAAASGLGRMSRSKRQ